MNKINRRTFLKKTAGAAGLVVGFPYIVPSSVLGAGGSTAPSNRIVMGCIGMGGQGTGNMKSFMRFSDVQVVAVCDVETKSGGHSGQSLRGREPTRQILEDYYAKQKPAGTYKGCDSYSDFRQLLARDDIDTVTVCTPDHWHGLISIAAAKAGKDMYCEKPLTNTIAEGRGVCDALKRYGRILQTGSHERSRDRARFGCELVRNGRIGKLHTIRIIMPFVESHHKQVLNGNVPRPTMPVPEGFDYDMWLGPAPWAPYTLMRCHFWWRFILSYGGGEITDRGAHILDLAQLGNDTDDTGPVEIVARGKAAEEGLFDAFTSYDFECTYANGVRLISAKKSNKSKRGVLFEGSDGWVFIHVHGGQLSAEPKSLLTEFIGPNEIHLGRSAGHRRDFLDAVKSRRQPIAHAEIGHRTATICHLLNIAMLTGRKLKWDPVTEQITNDAKANSMLARPMRSPWRL